MTMMMMDIIIDDSMDVEMPDFADEFDLLEVVESEESSSSKVLLEEWRKPACDDVLDELMQIDVQLEEDLLDEKFFFDPCLSPTSALDDLVFANTSLDEKELTLFAYPSEDNFHNEPAVPTVPSNIPTPPPSFTSKPKPRVTTTPTTAPRAHMNMPPPKPVAVPSRATRPGATPVPVPHHQAPYYPPVRFTAPRVTMPKKNKKSKKAPPKLNYIPAPAHMQPQPIAVAAAAVGAKRAAAVAARMEAAARKSPSRKSPSPKRTTKNKKTSVPPPPAFMKDEKYQSTLQKLTESMIRSSESRKCFHMMTPKTEKYARSKNVGNVLTSIEQSTRQIQTYLQGPAYRYPPSQTPCQPRKK